MHNFKLKGFFSWEIVDEKSGIVVRKSPPENNLILNQGRANVASYSFAQNIAYCAVGAGTAPPLLTDTGLADELQRTGDSDMSVDGGTTATLVGNLYSLIKTFRFPTNRGQLTIGQIGWSYASTAGNNLFSKALIVNKDGNPGTVTLTVGQYLRVKYTLQITISPSTTQTGSANIVGWTAPGQYNVQLVGLKAFNADGSVGNYDAGAGCNEPAVQADVFIGTSSAALAAFGSATDRVAGTNYTVTTTNTYLGNGVLVKTASLGRSTANSSTLRSMGVGANGSSYTNSGFVFLFDGNQTKASTHLLPLQFVYSWA